MEPTSARRWLTAATAGQRRLVDHLTPELDDDLAGSPSLLPGWSIGHVLTHLARAADSHVRLIDAASRGEVANQYPGGREGRAEEIDAGARRSAEALLDDLRAAFAAWDAAWDRCTPQGWAGTGIALFGDLPIAEVPFLRTREVEVHHADLGLPGYTPASWPADYVREDLRRQTMVYRSRIPLGGTVGLPAAALALPEHERLAWLLGRTTPPGLDPVAF